MYKSSNFWRESQIALDSQLYDKYWHYNVYEKAWLIAAMETRHDLHIVMDEFGTPDDD